mmetsp:Transcript_33871/g.68954  ORF Transcript_33871/g.68954 Transcript_33871/m.68954 type:complete len:802 (+) Transcript_33871:185-2590(+)
MAPSTNTTRPRTGSLSLRNNPTLHNYYHSSSGGGGHQNNNPQQQYYQSLTRQNSVARRGIEKSGIEKSYHSITNVLKGGIASFDSSLDSRSSRGSLGGSRGISLSGSMESSGRGSSRGSSMGSYSTRGGHSDGQRSNQQHCSVPPHPHQQQQAARSSMEKTPMTSNRHTTNHTATANGARASTSSQTTTSTAYQHGGGVESIPSHEGGGVQSIPSYEGGAVQSIPSYAPSTLESVPSFTTSNDDDDERRQSLREIKAALREEKIRNTLSFADSDMKNTLSFADSAESEESIMEGGEESVDEMERLLRGGMESVPSFASSEGGVGSVPSFGSTTEGASLRNGSMESRNTNSSSLGRMEGSKTSESGDGVVGQLCTVQESTTAAGGGVDDHRMMMMFNQPSRESLDTFRHEDTSSFTNNNNTSRKSSSGLYTANLSKERESLDTFKKTCKKGVSKMSQASFGKIRDILAGEGHHHGGGHVNNMAAAAARRTSNTHNAGGYRESGIGLGGILQFGRSNSDDEEMSFFVSDGDGKVHKEKVPLVNEDEEAFVTEGGLNGGGQTKKKMLLLEQAKFQHGETMKVTNVSRGGEEMKNKKPTVSFQQQQQRSVFHMKKDEHKMTTTAPQSPIPPSGNTPPLVRSVKKATKAVSHSMKHEVVPATKAMAALTVKLVERGEKKMKDGVAPKLRAVALDIDSRLNHHHQRHNDGNNNGGGFVGLQHIEGKGDYVCDPNYQVVRTPQHIDPQTGRRAYGPNAVEGHNFDPNTPACLLGALTAGTMFNYDITHPEHPEYLPEGIPRVLEVAKD